MHPIDQTEPLDLGREDRDGFPLHLKQWMCQIVFDERFLVTQRASRCVDRVFPTCSRASDIDVLEMTQLNSV
ncbi:hypothetical protein XH97_03155 [Bradyrhizobium sp. CCBAU 53380]|nr:hypothetical protein [Bradyrhizobium sp. CCBAU 53380]